MARASSLYRSSQQPSQIKAKYKFPILDPQELVLLYDTMGFDINESNIMKPTSLFMKSLIHQIMDKFLYISPHSIRDKVSKTGSNDEENDNNNHVNDNDNNDNDNNDDDENNNETQNSNGNGNFVKYDIKTSISIVACQRIMYRFLCDCGVDDFSIRDISKPDNSRLRIILSALINYARFREERMSDLDELMDKNDQVLDQYKQLVKQNKEIQTQIDKITTNLNNQSYTLDDLFNNNEKLENQLRDLRIIQKQLTDDHEKYRGEKTGLVNELENQSALYIETEKDLEEIRPYIKESPESIKELISKMKESENKESELLKQLENKLKNITISLDSFQFLIQDLNSLQKITDDLNVESVRSKSYDDKLKSLKNQTVETKEEASEYTRKMIQIERQLKHNEERISKLKSLYIEKMSSLQDKITTQNNEFNTLKSEKNLEDMDLSEKETQINDWTAKISEIHKQYEFECKEASFDLEKLNSKVLFYINEIKNKINESKDLL
ncbi:hypothetical protein C6P42_002065 [Pichia californica]|nr:hypothetical protein C6P42_002065 [[Candida] californica]